VIVKIPRTKRPSKVDIALHKTDEEKKQERKRKTTVYLEKKTPCYINPMNNSYFSTIYIEHLKTSYPYRSYYGKANNECQHCGAVFWYEERKKICSHKGYI